MPRSTNPPFHDLRSKLREWKAGDLLRPGEHSRGQFRAVAPISLLPPGQRAAPGVGSRGPSGHRPRGVSGPGLPQLTIDDVDIEVSFAPCDIPDAFRLSTCRMGSQDAEFTRLLAYRDLGADVAGVMGVIEEAVLCALAPRRTTKPSPIGEPPSVSRS